MFRLYLQKMKLFAPVECIFTTGHHIKQIYIAFRVIPHVTVEEKWLSGVPQNVCHKMKHLTEQSHDSLSSLIDSSLLMG